MKKRTKLIIIAAALIICVLLVGGIVLSAQNNFFSKWGLYLGMENKQSSNEGKYLTLSSEFSRFAIDSVDAENIIAIGENILITSKEIEQAKEFYLLSGSQDDEALQLAITYMEKYESMYLEARKNGFDASDEEIDKKISELKLILPDSNVKDGLQELINAFGSEEAYWEYEKNVYRKSLPIEKYREKLQSEFLAGVHADYFTEETQNEWNEWYESFQMNLAEKQQFCIVGEELSQDQIEKLKKFLY